MIPTFLLHVLAVLLLCLLVAAEAQYDHDDDLWQETAKVTPFDASPSDVFGFSTALQNDTLFVTALRGPKLANGDRPGAVYIYQGHGNGAWSDEEEDVVVLTSSDAGASDRFGESLAIYEDTLVISALHNVHGDTRGAVYVFVRLNHNNWQEQVKLTAGDRAGESLGDSISLHKDTLVVGARDRTQAVLIGSAMVFVRTYDGGIGGSASWSRQATLLASDGKREDQFGVSVAVEGDTIVVGAEMHDNGSTNVHTDTGAAYVFERHGNTWSERAKLTNCDTTRRMLYFGSAVDVHENTVAVASWWGVVCIFVREDEGGSWPVQATLTARNSTLGDSFGKSIALQGDNLVVGAPRHAQRGAAYVFARSGGSWEEQTELSTSHLADDAAFGLAVAVDTNTVAVTSIREDYRHGTESGAAYIFESQLESTEMPFSTPTVAPTGLLTNEPSLGSTHPEDPSLFVRKFILFDAINDKRIASLSDGDVLDRSTIGRALNIKAATAGSVDSVIFALDGVEYHTENRFPYMLGGDEPRGDYKQVPEFRQPGTYTVTATPYSEPDGTGMQGISSSITITLT